MFNFADKLSSNEQNNEKFLQNIAEISPRSISGAITAKVNNVKFKNRNLKINDKMNIYLQYRNDTHVNKTSIFELFPIVS